MSFEGSGLKGKVNKLSIATRSHAEAMEKERKTLIGVRTTTEVDLTSRATEDMEKLKSSVHAELKNFMGDFHQIVEDQRNNDLKLQNTVSVLRADSASIQRQLLSIQSKVDKMQIVLGHE